jgi:quercetin dioxygenase-like cupin family protein
MPFLNLSERPKSEPVDGFTLKFVHSDTMTAAFWNIRAGAVMPEHSHPHEQIAVLLDGEFELTLGGETSVLEEGDVAIIPSGVPHSGRAISRCRMCDAFHPRRDDFR